MSDKERERFANNKSRAAVKGKIHFVGLMYMCAEVRDQLCISYKRLLDLFFPFCHKGNFLV